MFDGKFFKFIQSLIILEVISLIGLIVTLALVAVLVPCCPISVICPPLCVFTLPMIMMVRLHFIDDFINE
jgi:hypothetical protein